MTQELKIGVRNPAIFHDALAIQIVEFCVRVCSVHINNREPFSDCIQKISSVVKTWVLCGVGNITKGSTRC